MLPFLKLPDKEQREILRISQAQLNIAESILEKDVWVSYVLDLIFNRLALGHRFMFKGGTSLSKCYGMINRFSEDIDLSLNMEELGFGGSNSPENTLSKTQRKKRLDELKEAGNRYTEETLFPSLQEKITEEIPVKSDNIYLEKDDSDALNIIVEYDSQCSDNTYNNYFEPKIRIEPGAKARHKPTENVQIFPLIGDSIPEFKTKFTVKVLIPARTFWEKATYIHVVNNHNNPEKFRIKVSRHLYDLAIMADHPEGKAALNDFDLLSQVVEHKSLYFASGWADYSGAKPGTIQLMPPPELMDAYKSDYKAMDLMFYQDPPAFDELIAKIQQIEKKINS
ncbi:MAG: nucleotidyl transferase AbiEii/AbiGii toxin family protein [Proteobacteria bacterium]|nr:nucleotidyl transferase AbiEii/AbiGii toxin family protein [Pseudomonadota bacterium]MBU1708772.1 nucleotidyl transferase AbiEii/AbiGii toxin family protein [Pseudomonadota bacterium]